jgi:hypothetical protein
VVVPFHFDDFSAPLRENGKAPALPFQDMAGFLKCISECKPMPEILQKETFDPLTF